MSSRTLIVPLAVVAAVTLAGCSLDVEWHTGSRGDTTSEDRGVPSDVTAVDLGTSGTLTLAVGDPSLTVTAGANVLRDITTEVTDGTLVLGMSAHWPDPGTIDYALTLPDLSSVRLSGSGEVTGEVAGTGDAALTLSGSGRIELDALDADDLTVTVGGSGEIVVPEVAATSTAVRIGGSGRAELSGRTESLDVAIPGSGEVAAAGLVAQDVTVRVPGSGLVEVDAERTLDVRVSGSGSVDYTGDARVTRSVTGSGSVTGP